MTPITGTESEGCLREPKQDNQVSDLVGEKDARDRLSVGQHHFLFQVLLPYLHMLEREPIGHVKHYDAA